jgi:hypothetical protein
MRPNSDAGTASNCKSSTREPRPAMRATATTNRAKTVAPKPTANRMDSCSPCRRDKGGCCSRRPACERSIRPRRTTAVPSGRREKCAAARAAGIVTPKRARAAKTASSARWIGSTFRAVVRAMVVATWSVASSSIRPECGPISSIQSCAWTWRASSTLTGSMRRRHPSTRPPTSQIHTRSAISSITCIRISSSSTTS